jgi:hypothetical protein
VLRLAERLRAHGLEVWLDDWVIEPGDDIYLAIEGRIPKKSVVKVPAPLNNHT